jgi:hypothetical protein
MGYKYSQEGDTTVVTVEESRLDASLAGGFKDFMMERIPTPYLQVGCQLTAECSGLAFPRKPSFSVTGRLMLRRPKYRS